MRKELKATEMNMVNGGLLKRYTKDDIIYCDVCTDDGTETVMATFNSKDDGLFGFASAATAFAVENGYDYQTVEM